MNAESLDPRGLIRESYRIEGITIEECRSIFLDWALSLPMERDQASALRELALVYADDAPNHPMSQVMREGMAQMGTPRRRGGWKARRES